MSNKFISINDAAELSNKSVQTIRRAIKANKLATRKVKTPQGFHYLVNREALATLYGLKIVESKAAESTENTAKTEKSEKAKKVESKSTESESMSEEGGVHISAKDFREFTKTLQSMVAQHSEERQNFMRLINTLQEKVFVMENQVNLLKAPQKKWFQVWK